MSHDHLRAAAGAGSAGAVSVAVAPSVVVSVGFAVSSAFFSSAGFFDLDLNKPARRVSDRSIEVNDQNQMGTKTTKNRS